LLRHLVILLRHQPDPIYVVSSPCLFAVYLSRPLCVVVWKVHHLPEVLERMPFQTFLIFSATFRVSTTSISATINTFLY